MTDATLRDHLDRLVGDEPALGFDLPTIVGEGRRLRRRRRLLVGASAVAAAAAVTVAVAIPKITGSVKVTLTITDTNGCTSSCSDTESINPPADCIVSLNPSTCPGTTQTNELGVTPASGATIKWTVTSTCASISGPDDKTNVVVTAATCCGSRAVRATATSCTRHSERKLPVIIDSTRFNLTAPFLGHLAKPNSHGTGAGATVRIT